MSENACIFCQRNDLDVVAENDLAFAVRDKFPVKPLHTLLITKRHVSDIFGTTAAEREALHELAHTCRAQIATEDQQVAGFNFGSNVGLVAGQKLFHAHVHLIPRRAGDIPPPPARQDE